MADLGAVTSTTNRTNGFTSTSSRPFSSLPEDRPSKTSTFGTRTEFFCSVVPHNDRYLMAASGNRRVKLWNGTGFTEVANVSVMRPAV